MFGLHDGRKVRSALEIVGRDQEVRVIDGFLSESAPGILVLEGEAGIGKTTLWRHGVLLSEREWLALACSPTEAESALAFAAACDLLGPYAEEVVGKLPLPQRRALAAALLLDEVEGAAVDPRAVAVAFLGALRELAGERPVLVAVDDIQWLDEPSALLLEFALRRVQDKPIAFLLTRRVSSESRAPLGLDRISPERVRRLSIGPISIGALHRLLRSRLGVSFPRPLLRRVHETAGGNPLCALELGRVLREREVELQAGVPLPVPAMLSEIVRDRIASLAPEVRAALAAAAALATPTVSAVGAEDELDTAARAGIVEIDAGRIRFTHPLLAAAAYAAVPAGELRRLHWRLAEVVADPEERARHVALAAEGPNEKIAAELDEAARRAAARGAPASAAEFSELAADLTPADRTEDRSNRRFATADAYFVAGDMPRAGELFEELATELPPGGLRSDVFLRLAEIHEGFATAVHYAERALADAEGDAARSAAAENLIGIIWIGLRADLVRALEHLRRAVGYAERAGDPVRLALNLAHTAHLESLTGRITPGLLERAVALEEETGVLLDYGPTFVLGLRLMYQDRLAEARERLMQVASVADEQGDEPRRAYILLHLGELECRVGNFAVAADYAAESRDLSEQMGSEQLRAGTLYVGALAAASLGQVEEARSLAAEGIELAGGGAFMIQNASVLGFLELSLGDAVAAAGHLRPLPQLLERMGYGEPSVNRVLPNAIEALVQVGPGELDDAERLQARLEQASRELDSPWASATAARCRGLLVAARGDLDAALAHLEQALDAHERLPNPLERGRTLLALGTVRRRRKEKRAAREALDSAIAIFDALPAPLWAERARAERARIGGRVAAGELTESERRIAELVAQGRSNKEVAAQLFITPRSVEGHLTRIYEKLGVRSRTELAHRLPTPTP